MKPNGEPVKEEEPVFEMTNAVREYEFDMSELKPTEHNFIQKGNFITCVMSGHHHGSHIPQGQILTMEDGKYAMKQIQV